MSSQQQHLLMKTLNALSRLSSTLDKVEICLQRVNSHEYVVNSSKGSYYISQNDSNIFWHVFPLNGMTMTTEPRHVEHHLDKAINWCYEELFKL